VIAKERLSKESWVPPWLHHQHVARYEWAAGYCGGRRVLDAACGIGYGSALLRDRGAREVDAFDLSGNAIAEAQRSYPREGVRFSIGDAARLPVPDRHYDVFVSLETIEHIRDDRGYLEEARRVLAPGGTFLCSTPNRALLNPGRALHDPPFNPFHVREYTLDELESLLCCYFPELELFGQSPFGLRYSQVLGVIGARAPMTAVRLHQLRKVAGIPWERRERHLPRRLPLEGPAEVLIAVCRVP